MLWCAIGLKDRIRMPALLRAVRAAEGDVHVGFREGAGECGEGSRGVEVGDEERRVQPRDLNVDAVNRTDAHLASAELSPRTLHDDPFELSSAMSTVLGWIEGSSPPMTNL